MPSGHCHTLGAGQRGAGLSGVGEESWAGARGRGRTRQGDLPCGSWRDCSSFLKSTVCGRTKLEPERVAVAAGSGQGPEGGAALWSPGEGGGGGGGREGSCDMGTRQVFQLPWHRPLPPTPPLQTSLCHARLTCSKAASRPSSCPVSQGVHRGPAGWGQTGLPTGLGPAVGVELL